MYSSNQQKQRIFLPPNLLAMLLVVLLGVSLLFVVILNPGFCWAFQQQHEKFLKPVNNLDVPNFNRSGANCSNTAFAAFKACQSEIKEEFWMAVGKCSNLSDPQAAAECFETAREETAEAKQLCQDQLEARLQVCDDLGQKSYDPELIPENFLDPEVITSANANPFFPLVAGTQWVYEGKTEEGTEVVTVTVTDKIKEIEYPAESGQIFFCVVVRDVVELDGELIEDTDDWYAQDLEGNVWYFGEIAKNYEDGELVDIEGSWKAGVEGAIAGISMPADPRAGDIYRQEYALGEAEDIATVVNRDEEEVIVPFGSFSEDILKTGEYTPIEPEVFENKYYAPFVGMILEVDPESGARLELVDMITP